MLRRRPELLDEHGSQIRTKVRPAVARIKDEERRRYAAELAHAQWAVLGEHDRPLELLAAWEPPEEPVQANYLGVDGRALPLALMFEYLATADLGTERVRALVKHHLLDPVVNALDLGAVLPELAEEWVALGQRAPHEALTRALVAQLDGWTRVGPALVLVTAGASVDRMPTPGPRRPDPTGVSVTVHVVNDSRDAQPLEIDVTADASILEPIEIPALAAKRIVLGPMDDEPLEPGRPFEVTLPVRVGPAYHCFTLRGTVGVTW